MADMTPAEKAAADAMAQDPQAGAPVDLGGQEPNPDSDVPTDPAPPEEVADAQAADPTSPGPDAEGNPVMPTGNSISDQGSTLISGPEDPGPIDPEEAKSAAAEEAQAIAASAAENKPDPVEEAPEEPEAKEDTTFVVYKSIEGVYHDTGGFGYPGRFLTVTFKLDEDEDGNDVFETATLEERIPLEVPVSHAEALTALESDHYTIESA